MALPITTTSAFRRNILRAVAVEELNVALFQKSGHRRIDILVRAGDVKTLFLMAAAAEPIAVPQIPRKWKWRGAALLTRILYAASGDLATASG